MRHSARWTGLIAFLCIISLVSICHSALGTEAGRVTLWHLPDGAIQPQAVVDSSGNVHIIYFKAGATDGIGNLFYVRLAACQTDTSTPVRVNSEDDCAGSIGTVRTAQIAVGKGGRIHVVWNGLGPKGTNGYPVAYQAYARQNDAATGFEPQRNLITWATGVDGGGSVAADKAGNVYVTWHALAGATDEAGRAVFVAHSSDSGATFTKEKRANPEPTGACGCCGMRAFADASGVLYVLYRAATRKVERGTMLLVSRDKGQTFTETNLDRWNINTCPMSTYALAEGPNGILAAWETSGRVNLSTIIAADLTVSRPIQAAGSSQKHPFVTAASNGQVLLTWAEGTGWQRGGSLAWQVVGKDGILLASGKKSDAVPVWGLATAYAKPDGSFVIIY